MKAFAHRLHAHPTYLKALEWGKLLTITGSAQIVVQALGMISGILVIRLLPPHEYALYTLANTMLGTMTLLADGGITTGVMAQAGKVWKDSQKLGLVLTTGLDLRKKFAIASLLLATPVLLLLLLHHNAGWLMSFLIIISLIPAFFAALSSELFEIVPKLRQDIAPLQKIQVKTNLSRLALLGITIFAFPWAFVAVLASSLPQLWANGRLREISMAYADQSQKPDPLIRKDILVMVKRILPGVIYYCLSGQITIWLISIFGSTTAVAQVGALSRLAMVTNLFSVLFFTLVLPRFARLPNNSSLLLRRYSQIQAGLLALVACIIGIVWIFSSEILWVLGRNYSGLTSQLVLFMVGSCFSLIAGICLHISNSRGWVISPVISIPMNVASILIGTLLFDVSLLKGILMLNVFVAVNQVIMHIGYGFIMIIKGK